ncbi:proline-rich domain-containing protein [Streptomyces sp. NPDC017254]|uniref:proline-rich domain-containing protein n=1 Tax=unclassified Streptomyces TaxID=2593676 RepID=UPI0037BB1EB4
MSRTTLSERGDARMADGDGLDTGTWGGLRRALPWVAFVVAAGSGALLAVGAFLGLYVRPTSDDWCALWKARDMGALGITADFYRTQNGRVTNAFVTGLLYSDGMRGPKLLPALLVVALVSGLFLLGRAALRSLRRATRPGGGPAEPPAVLLVAAAALVSALLFFAGTRSYQVLLWAPATISHTLPSVIGLWTVLVAVRAARSGLRWARTAAVGSALLIGAALGMLSEPFTLVGGLFAVTVGVLCLPRLGWARTRYVSTWCAAACLGLLGGLTLLYTSPGARWRRAQNPQEPMSAAQIGETFHDWWRLWQTVGGQWAYLGAVAVGVLLGLALAATGPRREGLAPNGTGPRQDDGRTPVDGGTPRNEGRTPVDGGTPRNEGRTPVDGGTPRNDGPPPGNDGGTPPDGDAPRPPRDRADRRASSGPALPPRTLFRVVVLLPLPLIALASLAVVLGLRSGYGDVGWTYGRTWTSFLLPLLLVLCAYGAWGGHLLGRRLLTPGRPAGRAAALVTAGAVAVGSAAALVQPVYTLTTDTVVRAAAWDRQNARIRQEVAAGARDVAYGPLLIGGLTEPLFASTYARDWAAQCTAKYYRVDRVHRP